MEPHFSNAYNTNNSNYLKKPVKRLLFIDSRDCNNINNDTHTFNQAYPNPFHFNVKFESSRSSLEENSIGIEPYRNIEKITLKHVGIPKIKDEHYVILDIPDLFDYIDSTDNAGSHRTTTVLYYDNSLNDNSNVRNVKQTNENYEFEFSQRLNAINVMNINITKHGGEKITPNDFNTSDNDSPDYLEPLVNNIHTTFLFEITYLP